MPLEPLDKKTLTDGERLRDALAAADYGPTPMYYEGCDRELVLAVAEKLNIDTDRLTLADGDGSVYLDRAYNCTTEYDSDRDARSLFEDIEYLCDQDNHYERNYSPDRAWAVNVRVHYLEDLTGLKASFNIFELLDENSGIEYAYESLCQWGQEEGVEFAVAGRMGGWIHINTPIEAFDTEEQCLNEVEDIDDIRTSARLVRRGTEMIKSCAWQLITDYEEWLADEREEEERQRIIEEREPGEAAAWAARGVVTVG